MSYGDSRIAVILVHGNFIFPSIVNTKIAVIAVDLFLIISGFLIGKILLDTKNKNNFFRRFYVRRIFRIFPLATLAIFTGSIIALLFDRGQVHYHITYFLFRISFCS